MLSPLLPLPTASVKVPCMAGLLTYGSLLCPTFPRIRSGILDIARRLQSRGRLWILAPFGRSAFTTFPINPQRLAF